MAVKALELLDVGNNIVKRCHDYLQRLLVAAGTLPGTLHWLQTNFDRPGRPTSRTASSTNQLGFGNDLVPPVSGEPSYTISPIDLSQSFLEGPPLMEDNVGNLMIGGDLRFLDFYFPPQNDSSSLFPDSV